MTRHQFFPACPPFVNTVYTDLYQNSVIYSLRSKCFPSSYCAKVEVRTKKKNWKWEGEGGRGRISFSPLPLHTSSFFLSSLYSRRTHAETLATQAIVIRRAIPRAICHQVLDKIFISSRHKFSTRMIFFGCFTAYSL